MRRMFLVATGLLVISLLMNPRVLAADVPAPVAYWLFDKEGDIVLDSSGNENHGEIIGKLKWVKGKFGQAIEFPGKAGNYILVTKLFF